MKFFSIQRNLPLVHLTVRPFDSGFPLAAIHRPPAPHNYVCGFITTPNSLSRMWRGIAQRHCPVRWHVRKYGGLNSSLGTQQQFCCKYQSRQLSCWIYTESRVICALVCTSTCQNFTGHCVWF